MFSTNATSNDRRSQVHTEVRVPVEAVMTRVVWFIFGVIEVLIAIRFVLLLFGANAQAGFVRMIYGVSNIFMAPFAAIFSTQRVSGGAVFEWSALVAIAIYALIAWGLTALIYAVTPRANAQTVERVVQDEDVRVP
jgi:hypothetical protein